MSLEQLVITLFVVIPLFEGLMRVLRRTRRQEGQPDQLPAPSSPPRPSAQLPKRTVHLDGIEVEDVAAATRPLPAPLLPPRRHAAERLMRREGFRVSEETPRVPVSKVAARAHARVRGEAGLQRIGPARDLRPVIALATILGPCRALGSRDAL